MQLERYIAVVLRRRWLVVVLTTLVMLAITAGARFITVTNDYRGLDRNAAIVESIRINAYPVFITSVTTAIGFLSLNASGFAAVSRLG